MFDIFNLAMVYMLDALKALTGSYGMAIIAVTVLIRGALWPLNNAQTRSMKQMQQLQPKLKAMQEQYKNDPQKLQAAMMSFYAEHKFNPFAGCLPLLVQLPIFIALYGALNSPEFLAQAGNESFLFINKLYNTMQTHRGEPFDHQFALKPDDTFETAKAAQVHLTSGKTIERTVSNPHNVLIVKPKPLIPGDEMQLFVNLKSLGLNPNDYAGRIKAVDLTVVNRNTREVENLTLTPLHKPENKAFVAVELPTQAGKDRFNWDVVILVGLYALVTLGYQLVMEKSATVPKPDTPQAAMQAKMMRLMPLMFVGMLFFIPLPAGVLLYLVVTLGLMMIQTAWVNWRDGQAKDGGEPPSSSSGSTSSASQSVVQIQAKRV